MPFKTKRQKVAASQRRFTFVDKNLVNYPSAKEQVVKESTGQTDATISSSFKSENKSTKRSVEDSGHIENDYQYVAHDLVKIILLAGSIIGLQLILKFFFRG